MGNLPDYLKEAQNVRYVQLAKFDTGCPCGGTHVDHVKELGRVIIQKVLKKGKNVRVSYKVQWVIKNILIIWSWNIASRPFALPPIRSHLNTSSSAISAPATELPFSCWTWAGKLANYEGQTHGKRSAPFCFAFFRTQQWSEFPLDWGHSLPG